ncbi:MAG TPA: DUF433 domain-containing protein [Hanamia sp.]|nr:DUF433 domain-containing protein [Hanamia sp.]
MDWRTHISSDPSIMFGKACIKNTRIAVDLILEKLGKGYTIPDLLAAYPKISEEDIKACMLYASVSINNVTEFVTQ